MSCLPVARSGATRSIGNSRSGKLSADGTVYRVGFLRADLKVTSHGGAIKPGFALGSFARTEQVTSHGRVISAGMGVGTALNFQSTGGGKASVNGDFVMTAAEVQKVIAALRGGGDEERLRAA
ncbi:DUF1259 domain-containing protein [Planomonospora sp. ID67723]|uniref:DUF1259 domain-containing protein n=1 Tax=Planomonospora sp. ID67723 TaxID=2738134 RepID=UPI0018C39856|nr:DUF1259 domain-containing protein [Planomonospora sp. ID67723]